MSCGYNNVCVRVLWWYWRQACSQQGYTFPSKGQVVEAKKYERGEVLKAVQYCAKNVVLLPEC